LHDYKENSKHKIGHFLTGNILVVFSFVALKNRIGKYRPGGQQKNKELMNFFSTKATKAIKDFLSKK
jgi:hypothetical protein